MSWLCIAIVALIVLFVVFLFLNVPPTPPDDTKAASLNISGGKVEDKREE